MQTVWRLLLMQCIAVLCAVVLAGFWGSMAAWSAFLGGCACLLPNGFFAMRIWSGLRHAQALQEQGNESQGAPQLNGFFLGEFVKIAVTLLLLFGVTQFVAGLVWPALLLGVVLVLKSNLIVLFWLK